MSLGSAMQISASGLTAERLRLDVISNNLANVDTTRGPNGQPYRREIVTLAERQPGGDSFHAMLVALRGGPEDEAPGAGVEVTSIQPDYSTPFKVIHDPGNPDADANGNVRMPNVNPVIEMVDMISASRAYEADVTAINAAKQMQTRAIDIGRA